MPQGTIKKLVMDRGFGFIKGNPNDLFFHHSAVADGGFEQIQEGATVEYEIEDAPGGKGPRAVNIRVL